MFDENTDLENRKCLICGVLEDESHVLLYCSLYTDLRAKLFEQAIALEPSFVNMCKNDQHSFLLTILK